MDRRTDRRLSTKELALAGIFAAMASGAALMVRFGTAALVPFSLLPFVAMLSGLVLGSRTGAAAMVVYVLLGLLGLPVFAKPPFGGLAYVLQPTFGFLIGFILCAYVGGRLVERKAVTKGEVRLVDYGQGALAGLALLYAVGLTYLYLILNFYLHRPSGVVDVLKIAFIPYVGLDLLKALVVARVAQEIAARVQVLSTSTFR